MAAAAPFDWPDAVRRRWSGRELGLVDAARGETSHMGRMLSQVEGGAATAKAFRAHPHAGLIAGVSLAASDRLETLRLDKSRMGPEGAAHLASGLAINTSLRMLQLQDQDLGDDGAERLASGLGSHPSLTSLRLRSCGFGDRGGAAVAAVLPRLRLRELSLVFDKAGADTARGVAAALARGVPSDSLSLYGVPCGDEGLRAVAAALTGGATVTRLELVYNRARESGVRPLLEAAAAYGRLELLSLQHNELGDGGSALLRRLLGASRSLTDLQVGSMGLGTRTAEALCGYLEGGGAPRLSKLSVQCLEGVAPALTRRIMALPGVRSGAFAVEMNDRALRDAGLKSA